MSIVPKTYQEWRHCIEIECGIPISQSFLQERIAGLANCSDHYTQQFTRLWGAAHLTQVRKWFSQAAEELS
ncbi:hypothetical protein [Stenotrophomonas sp. S39]|uniref:hypothetical protein n=1 Tax=Stenotrophomonas sp. S39 TaxID=2767451 RepID=UPI00190E1BA2|nr:hypothetical protein [Stenotrophomonas sp. S39]MBK0052729.1 hypothetical protein [Stenotrophomonas sp. S39]